MAKERHTVRVATYLILIEEGRILLQRRFSTGWFDGFYSLVSGHLDPDEPAILSMVREAKEEAGIDVAPEDLEMVHCVHHKSDHDYIVLYFRAAKWQGEPQNMEPHKCDDLSWFPLDNLPENLLPFIPIALENIEGGIAYSEYGW